MLLRAKATNISLIMAASVLGSGFALAASSPQPAGTLVVSFPSVRLARGERVVGSELTVIAATIRGITRIPLDWSLHLEPEFGSQTRLYGSSGHGASALESARALPEITLALDLASDRTSPQFSVEAVVHITADFQTTTSLKLKSREMLIRKRGK